MSSILTTASTSMVILDPRSRSRSRHLVLSQVVCEPRKQILEMSKKKNEISGAHFFFRGRWEIANRNSRNLHDTQKPDKNEKPDAEPCGCIRVQNPCYDERLAERRPNPFDTPIPGGQYQNWRGKQSLEHLERGHETRRSRRPKRGVAR